MSPMWLVFLFTLTDHCAQCSRASAVKVVELNPHEMSVRLGIRGTAARLRPGGLTPDWTTGIITG